MNMRIRLAAFARAEDGAVTVDWVVLTAAIVGIGLAVVFSLQAGVTALGFEIERALGTASVVTLGELGSGGGSGSGSSVDSLPCCLGQISAP